MNSVLTQTSRAGTGVQYLKWIIASKLGKWPSRAPEKHSLWKERELNRFFPTAPLLESHPHGWSCNPLLIFHVENPQHLCYVGM